MQHEIWAHWLRYQLSCCVENADGSLTVPAEYVERWRRQMETVYSELAEPERKSDREQADKILQLLELYFFLSAFSNSSLQP